MLITRSSTAIKFSSSISQNGDPYRHRVMKDFNSWCRLCNFRKGEGIVVSGDPQIYLGLLLAIVKKQLPCFKIGSVGEESCVEVCEISVNDDEPNSVRIFHTTSVQPLPESYANEREMVQNEVEGETVIDNGSNILGLEQNGIVVCHSEKSAGEELFVEAATNDETTIMLPPCLNPCEMKIYTGTDKIDEWAFLKRKKVNALCVCSGNKGIKGTHKGDPSCSNPPPMLAAAVEKVTTRLQLNDGSFDIKYQDEDNNWILIAWDEDLEECIVDRTYIRAIRASNAAASKCNGLQSVLDFQAPASFPEHLEAAGSNTDGY
ncbi:hypothetical protein LguiB_012746 [Lonicera macranthoides]